MKKIGVIGHPGSVAVQQTLIQHPDVVVIVKSDPEPDFRTKPVIDIDRITLKPKYFPPSKSKFHK